MRLEIILNILFTAIISILNFGINKFFIEYFGVEKLGVLKVFLEILQYLNLAEMGLEGVGSFYLYKPLAEKNLQELEVIIGSIEKIYIKISKFIFIFGIAIIPFLKYFISNITLEFYLIWIIMLLNTTITYIYMKDILVLISDQKYLLVKSIQSIGKLVFQIFQLVFIIYFNLFLGYILMWSCEILFQLIIFKKIYKEKYYYIKKTEIISTEITKNLKNNFFHKLSAVILFNTDSLLIAKYLGVSIVGIYTSYRMILNLILMLVKLILNIIRPRLGKKMALLSSNDIYISWNINNIYFFLFALYSAINIKILINPFLKLWIGEEYLFDNTTVLLFSIISFLEISRCGIELYKECAGYFSDINLSILESILNLLFSIILVKIIGLNGILLGTIISTSIVRLILRPIYVYKNCFNKDYKEYLKLLLIQTFYGGIIIYIVGYWLSEESILNWKMLIKKGIDIFIIMVFLNATIYLFNKKINKKIFY